MKRLIFIIIFSFIFLFNLELEGFYDVIDSNSFYLGDIEKFNYIELSRSEYSIDSIKYNNELEKDNIGADFVTIRYNVDIFDFNDEYINSNALIISYLYEDGNFNHLSLLFNNVSIMSFEISDSINYINNNQNEIFYLNDYNENYAYFKIKSKIINSNLNIDTFKSSLFYSLYIKEVSKDIKYININDPINVDEILDNVLFYDDNNHLLSDFNIIFNDYDINNLENKIYNIILKSTNNNITYLKKIELNVLNMDEKIKLKDINTLYNKKLNDNDFYNYIEIDDVYKNITIKSDYFYNYRKKGQYDYIVYVEFYNGITYYSKAKINVYDDIAPYVLDKKDINIYLNNSISKEDIKDYFWIYDEMEGTIKNDNIVIFGYEDINFDKIGEYNLMLIAYDSSNNFLSESFIINIILNDEIINIKAIPNYLNKEEEIDIENNNIIPTDYQINVYTNRIISISDIYDLLKEDGIILEDNVIIESDYFDNGDIKGEYELKVKYENGDIYYYSIKVNEKEIEENKKSYSWIIYMILGILLLASIIVFIIVRYYRGKKN